jgi:2-amino-4-hydroxy-6-hydroxymethyldihydropteridine diphosphokinase
MKIAVYMLLGSNLGDRKQYLDTARKSLCESVGTLLAQSSVYESEAWGFVSENAFLNQVVLYETALNPNELLRTIKLIEAENGRVHTKNGYSSRNLDIDILFYGDLRYSSDILTIPHLMLHKRRFTLLPMAEIAPDFIHPVFNLNIRQLLERCDDKGKVVIYEI